jgi:glycosyltransferase involved in cell wall biosynthesis
MTGRWKIWFLDTSGNSEIFSGPEKYARRMRELLANDDSIRFVYYARTNAGLRNKLFFNNSAGARNEYLAVGVVALIKAAFRDKPTVIHLPAFDRIYFLLHLFRPFLKYKLVYSLHGIVRNEDNAKPELPLRYRLFNRLVEKYIFRDARKVLAFNEQLAEEAVQFYRSTAAIHNIPPGIDEEFFTGQRKLVNLSGRIEIIMLGSFARREDAARNLLPVLARFGDQIRITMVGFSDTTIPEGCTGLDVQFVPKEPVQGWSERLNAADIFIAPYRYESFSLSGIEAMAAECVPVFCNSIKAAELVIHGKSGFLYSPDDLSTLTDILTKLVTMPALRYQTAHDARKAVNNFRWEKLLPIQRSVYSELSE